MAMQESYHERHFLYRFPDRPPVVFHVSDNAYDASPVRFGPALSVNELYVDIDAPADLFDRGKEISEHRAHQLTGFYLSADRALEQARFALSRVSLQDEKWFTAHAALLALGEQESPWPTMDAA